MGLQHTRLPCPSLSPRVCSNSYPLSLSCCPPSHPLSPPSPPTLSLSQHQGLSSELAIQNRWPKYRSFSISISPCNVYLGLISFRLTDLISLQSTRLSRVFSIPQLENINSLVLSLLYGPNLTSVHDYWKNHSFDYMDLY